MTYIVAYKSCQVHKIWICGCI